MTRTLAIVAAVFALSATSVVAAADPINLPAGPYKLDSSGKCHDAHGKFAKASFCAHHTYKMDSKGKCRDERGKFAPMGSCMR
jgi:hypothetical protein